MPGDEDNVVVSGERPRGKRGAVKNGGEAPVPADATAALEPAPAEEPWEDVSWRRSWLSYSDKFQNDYELEVRAGCPSVRVRQSAVAGKAKRLRQGDQRTDPALTGSTVWDAAIVCARYLALPGTWESLSAGLGKRHLGGKGVSVWELGSGTGLLGLAAASLGGPPHGPQSVLLTDLGGVVDLLRENIVLNQGPSGALNGGAVAVEVQELCWGDEHSIIAAMRASGGPPDLILGSDLVYRMPNVEPLLATLALAVPEGGAVVLAVDRQHCPEAVERFRAEAEAAGTFLVEEVSYDELDPGYRCRDVLVLKMWRLAAIAAPSAALKEASL